MQQIKVTTTMAAGTANVHAGRPTIPLMGRQPLIERKISDPSSACPKSERYPIPSFFEYRIKQREYDPL